MPVSPILERQTTYPFVRLAEAAARVRERGIDAVNFGPGATRYAHRRDEQVEIAALAAAYASLWDFLIGTV